MTKDKAIEILKEQYKSASMFMSSQECREYNDAIDMAIKALQNDVTETNFVNMVYKKDVLYALEKCRNQCCREDEMGDEWIHYETTKNEIECVQPVSIQANAVDMMSRQAAIDDAKSWVSVDEYEKRLQKNVIEWLKELPPAEPKTGRWIDTDNYYRRWQCSECGCHTREDAPYCPFCGSYNGGRT